MLLTSRAFHEQLKHTYTDLDERFAYGELPESDQMLTTHWGRL